MLDDLWQRVEAAGRDRTGIDVGFSNLDGGRPGSAGFDPDRHIEGLSELSSLGVTWNSVSVPGDSFNHALETLHEYGEKVIRA